MFLQGSQSSQAEGDLSPSLLSNSNSCAETLETRIDAWLINKGVYVSSAEEKSRDYFNTRKSLLSKMSQKAQMKIGSSTKASAEKEFNSGLTISSLAGRRKLFSVDGPKLEVEIISAEVQLASNRRRKLVAPELYGRSISLVCPSSASSGSAKRNRVNCH